MSALRQRGHFGGSTLAQLAWILGPFAVFLFVLHRLWVDAPVWDDYDAILGLLLRTDEIHATGEWLAMIFSQHNEHRIAVDRLLAIGLTRAFGQIDFRAMMLVGNLSILGTLLFIWREFRRDVPAPVLGAAAMVMLQLTYYEASLMASAAPPHLGAVFFAFGCIFFALREGAASLVLSIAFGALAAASQANGLLALPVAALGCAIWGPRRRAAVLGLLAVAAFVLYLHGFARPPQHPSPLVAFAVPIASVHLFCVNVGGVLPGTRASAILGAFMLLGFAWVAYKGLWRTHRVAALWTVFLLASLAAATVGRVGLGVINASRYAILSSSLLAILLLSLFALLRPQGWKPVAVTVLLGAVISIGVSWMAWPEVVDYDFRGKLLREAVPATPAVAVDRFVGAFYPNRERADLLLGLVAQRGYYFPPKQTIYPSSVTPANELPADTRVFGHVDSVTISRQTVTVIGWSDITGAVPSRIMGVVSQPPYRRAGAVAVIARQDVAFALHDASTVFSGFRFDLEYGSKEEARQAADGLCVFVEAPGRPATVLIRKEGGCGKETSVRHG